MNCCESSTLRRIWFSSIMCGIHLAQSLLIPSSLWIFLNTVPKVYIVLIVISLIVIRRSVSNNSLTVSIFFDEMDEGRPGLSSSVTELSPCSNLLYHLYKVVFFIVLFPKAVFKISNVSCLDFLFATQSLIAERCSRQPFCLFELYVSRDFVQRRMTSKLSLWRH